MRRRRPTRFLKNFYPIDGQPFEGELSYSDSPSDSHDRKPRRTLVTSVDAAVMPGETVQTEQGKYLLLAEHTINQFTKTFKVYDCTHYLEWFRNETHRDFVTGEQRTSSKSFLGRIHIVRENFTEEVSSKNFKNESFKFYTGAEVRDNDFLGTFRVEDIRFELGIRIGKLV